MADVESSGILEEIEALVSDKLQVVSYKWLSRNFLVTSNVAKRLLHQFVEKHGSGLEVVYTLAGWLKNDPQAYHIRLVSEPKLADAQQEFDGHCSVQVYSVQACIPKDPAALWNAEFVQAEELFKQPFAVHNCLRDNRFCGISNSFVKRNIEGAPANNVAPQPKTTGFPVPSKSASAHQTVVVQQPQERKVQQPSPKVSLHSPSVVREVKDESGTAARAHDQAIRAPIDKEKLLPLPAKKKKGQKDKSSETEGSLANMWGRASAKSKLSCHAANAVSAEGQICALEAVEGASTDEDGEEANFKRVSNGDGGKKRRVVLDLSEEEEFEDAVNLASPEPPKGKSCVVSEKETKPLVLDKTNLNFDQEKQERPRVKEEKLSGRESNQSTKQESSVLTEDKNNGISSLDKISGGVPEIDANMKAKVTAPAPKSPKRKKVMKTRIDERGREVTEVVWEGEEVEPKKADGNETKKSDSSSITNVANRPPPAKKSPAVGNVASSNATGKAGSKKGGNPKDRKQGNIMSFFKRV